MKPEFYKTEELIAYVELGMERLAKLEKDSSELRKLLYDAINELTARGIQTAFPKKEQ